MLGLRERMEENGSAPRTGGVKRSAAAPADPEVVDRPLRRRFSPSADRRRSGPVHRARRGGPARGCTRRNQSHSGSLKALPQKRGRKPERNRWMRRYASLGSTMIDVQEKFDKPRFEDLASSVPACAALDPDGCTVGGPTGQRQTPAPGIGDGTRRGLPRIRGPLTRRVPRCSTKRSTCAASTMYRVLASEGRFRNAESASIPSTRSPS